MVRRYPFVLFGSKNEVNNINTEQQRSQMESGAVSAGAAQLAATAVSLTSRGMALFRRGRDLFSIGSAGNTAYPLRALQSDKDSSELLNCWVDLPNGPAQNMRQFALAVGKNFAGRS